MLDIIEIIEINITKSGEPIIEQVILLAINKRLYDLGIITKEEKEAMDIEILRE